MVTTAEGEAWVRAPEELVGTVWERRWIRREGSEEDTSVLVRYVSAAYAFVDVRVAVDRKSWPIPSVCEEDVKRRRAQGFGGVTTRLDGVLRWHACLNLWPAVPDRRAAWAAAKAGRPLATSDAGTMEWVEAKRVWHEHAWPDATAYTEEWALIGSGLSLAALRGSSELLVVAGDWYARDDGEQQSRVFACGRVSTGMLVEMSACGPEGSRLAVAESSEEWKLLPGSNHRVFSTILAAVDVQIANPQPWLPECRPQLETALLVLKPLRPEDVEADFEAVMDGMQPSGYSPLQSVFRRHDDWPQPDLTREIDEHDLRRHHLEFEKRLAFAYTVLDRSDLTKVVGCAYINPPTRQNFDAECFCWIRASVDRSLDTHLEASLRAWLQPPDWPFHNVAFPGRNSDQQWSTWEAMPLQAGRRPRVAFDAKTCVLHRHTASGLIP